MTTPLTPCDRIAVYVSADPTRRTYRAPVREGVPIANAILRDGDLFLLHAVLTSELPIEAPAP